MGLATAKLLASRGALISRAYINEKALREANMSLLRLEEYMNIAI
jgi:hypothetical protein